MVPTYIFILYMYVLIAVINALSHNQQYELWFLAQIYIYIYIYARARLGIGIGFSCLQL